MERKVGQDTRTIESDWVVLPSEGWYPQRMDPRLSALLSEAATGEFSPVYLITGESLLVKEARSGLEEKALSGGLPEFNLTRFQSSTHSMEEILAAACTLPMMGPKRVVTVEWETSLDDKTAPGLAGYIEECVPTTVLLITAGKADGRSKVVKRIKSVGTSVHFGALKPRDAVDWLKAEASRKGYGIQHDAAALLVDEVGVDLLTLSSSLGKLVAFVGEQRPIARGDIEQAVERTREEVIWDLTDSVGRKNLFKALETVDGLLEAGQSPIMLVGLLARHFRQLWQVMEGLQQGGTPDSIAKQQGIHPFVAKKLSAQASAFSPYAMPVLFDALYEADKNLKSSRLAQSLILESLLIQLCRTNSVDRR